MTSGWRYRVASVAGTVALTAVAVTVANYPAVQDAFAMVPYLGRPAPVVLSNGALTFALLTMLVAVFVTVWPLFKPQPRRTLDTIFLTEKRLGVALLGMAALGYFDYTFRLPRSTLLLTAAALSILLPVWMVAIRRRPSQQSRAVLVGDDTEAMRDLLEATNLPVIGYVAPPSPYQREGTPSRGMADGGRVEQVSAFGELPRLGGLSRLEEVLVEEDVDTVLVAFAESDRAEFFGALDTCHEYGVSVLAHRAHAAHVLTRGMSENEELVELDLEPWDWLDHVVKRTFDIGFAGVGLLVLSPLIVVIAVAVKLDSPGPVLYSQKRTAEFGDVFTIHKFRSMVPEGEEVAPGEEDERVTRIGRILRRTHLDEIPQLWSILIGDMSVVGPRAAWTDEELLLEDEVIAWRQRWFVKPGLTGLAQIRGASSEDPQQKLRYDLQYIREQSFWFDLKIVIRQVWQVLGDIAGAIRS